MINKKSLWFLTLFSLILVLSVYYITMPSEMFLNNNSDYTKETSNQEKQETKVTKSDSKKEESELVVALRVEADEETEKEMATLKETLTSDKSTADEKNNAFEKLKSLNSNKSKEDDLEKKILKTYKLKSFVKINGDQITVVVSSDDDNVEIANNIMRTIQGEYDKRMYITVKFNTK